MPDNPHNRNPVPRRRKIVNKSKMQRRRHFFTVLILVIIIAGTSIGSYAFINHFGNNIDKITNNNKPKETPTAMPSKTPEPSSVPTETPSQIPTTTPTASPTSTSLKNVYDFSVPMPKSSAVDDKYFDGAMFLGDSRTEGFMIYSGLSTASSLTDTGIMIDEAFSKPVITSNGKKISLVAALEAAEKFSKIYIMFGVNELGWNDFKLFGKKYGELIDKVREINPNSPIYIQSILPVSSKKESSSKIYTNDRINSMNEEVKKICTQKKVYYLNVAEAVKDESGKLPDDAAADGVHMKKSYCIKWLEYLKTHTIENFSEGNV